VATARAVVGGGLSHGGGFRNRRSGEHNKDCVAHTATGRIRTAAMWATGKSLMRVCSHVSSDG
jgi:hypothetical protein